MKRKTVKVDLAYLLGQYGNGFITTEQFWSAMRANGYTQDSIDKWCDDYHKLTNRSDDDATR
jgi:hypothetical protein